VRQLFLKRDAFADAGTIAHAKREACMNDPTTANIPDEPYFGRG